MRSLIPLALFVLSAAATTGRTEQPVADSDEQLVKSLASKDIETRQAARQELLRRGAKSRAALLKVLNDEQQPEAVRNVAAELVQATWNDEVRSAFVRLFGTGGPSLRRLAAEALGRHAKPGTPEVYEVLVEHLYDDALEVRRAVYLALGRQGNAAAADALISVLRFSDLREERIKEELLLAFAALGKRGTDKLLSLADSGNGHDREAVVRVFAALRTRAAFEALPRLLRNPHLSSEQRGRLIHSALASSLLPPPFFLSPCPWPLLPPVMPVGAGAANSPAPPPSRSEPSRP